MQSLSRFLRCPVLTGWNENRQVSSPPWAVSEAKFKSIGKIKRFKIGRHIVEISGVLVNALRGLERVVSLC